MTDCMDSGRDCDLRPEDQPTEGSCPSWMRDDRYDEIAADEADAADGTALAEMEWQALIDQPACWRCAHYPCEMYATELPCRGGYRPVYDVRDDPVAGADGARVYVWLTAWFMP